MCFKSKTYQGLKDPIIKLGILSVINPAQNPTGRGKLTDMSLEPRILHLSCL